MTPPATLSPPTPARPVQPWATKPAEPSLITNPLDSPPLSSLVSGALPDITRVGDDALGIEKSTPSTSVFGLESTTLSDDSATETPDSPAYLLAIEPTSIAPEPSPYDAAPAISELESLASNEIEPMELDAGLASLGDDLNDDFGEDLGALGDDVEFELDTDRPPHDRSPTPAHTGLASLPTPAGDLELIMPADEPEAMHADDSGSIDFDLSALTPPKATPAHPTPVHRPTPGTAQVALEGLPLMELEVAEPTPVSNASVTSSDPLSLSSDLELVDSDATEFAPDADASDAADAAEVDAPFIMDGTFDAPDVADVDEEPIVLPTPSKTRKSTLVAEQSVELLKADIEGEPENWGLHRELAEAMLEAGDRDGGIRELEFAMNGAERSGDLDLASAIAEEIARLEPDVVKHHQKRVEYAFRTNDRPRLVEAYVALADSLLAADQADRARTVYQRVIDLAPDDMRARAALDSISMAEPEPAPPPPQQGKRRSPLMTPALGVQTSPSEPGAAESFVNLGDWLRDSEGPKDTRMVVAEQEPTGDEDADFADMLRRFKQGVAENVDAEDYQSHYDLAIAFKEMGLLDEAIAQFQKALAGPANRLPTFESLGQCFLEKGQPKLATSILSRALNEKASEDQLIGVLYLLGRAAEAQSSFSDAVTYYQRVFVLDIQFRDTADRLNELERAAR
jgi:tetratricopeptide (TPR) repeat protein